MSGSKRLTAFIRPTLPSWIRSPTGQAVAHVAARDVHDETQVRHDEFTRRVEVLVFVEAARKRELFVAVEHRDRRHLRDVSLEASDRAGQDERWVGKRERLASHFV